jgi:hypothetical protein
MARDLVERLGGNPGSEEAVRAVAVWLSAETGSTVYNNNPFNLATAGMRDLPGQIDRTANGVAIFATWQDGMAAAAQEIKDHYPQIATAIKKGDPGKTLSAIEKSNWRTGGYQNTLIPTYNTSGPPKVIVGNGSNIFDTPQSLAELASSSPGIADLFDINPGDATNWQWFETNVAALKDAMTTYDATGRRNAGTWTFTTIDGRQQELAFTPEMYYSIIETRAGYNRIKGDAEAEANDRETLRDTRAEVTVDQWKAEVETLRNLASQRVADGDLSGAARAYRSALASAAALLGLPPGVPVDTVNYAGQNIPQDELDRIQAELNKLLPKTDDNPTGSTVLGLFDPNARTPDGEPAIIFDQNGRARLNPNAAYVAQDADGKFIVVDWRSGGSDFVQDGNTRGVVTEYATVPRYMNTKVGVKVGTGENVVWIDPQVGQLPVSVIDTAGYRDPGAAAKDDTTASTAPPTPLLSQFAVNLMPGVSAPTDTSFNIGRGSFAQAPAAPTTPPVVSPDSKLVLPLNGAIPVAMVRYYDPQSKSWYQAYSLDDTAQGAGQYIIMPVDRVTKPPTVVANEGVKARITGGQLEVYSEGKWVAYSAALGPLSSIFHWYGTDKADGARYNAQGNRDQWLPIRNMSSGTFNAAIDIWDQIAFRTGVAPVDQKKVINAQTGFTVPGYTPSAAERYMPSTTTLAFEDRENVMSPDAVAAVVDAVRAFDPASMSFENRDRITSSPTAAQARFLAAAATQQAVAQAVAQATMYAQRAAVVAQTAAPATATPKVRPTLPNTPTTPAAPAPRPTGPSVTPRDDGGTAPGLVNPPAPPPTVKPKTPAPPPVVAPKPRPPVAPGVKPTLPGVSAQPRLPHERDPFENG